MGPAEGSGAVAGRVARPGTGGVVSRPGLFERLGASARVTMVSAPPGSGKTVLLRSWIGEAGLAERAAWVAVERGERDPQRFWLSRSEERRVGKECRSRWAPYNEKKKKDKKVGSRPPCSSSPRRTAASAFPNFY